MPRKLFLAGAYGGPPIHPGEILVEEFLRPLGLTKSDLAQSTGIPVDHLDQICLGKSGVIAETDQRLCRHFKQSQGFWLRLQAQHDQRVVRRER